MLKQKATIRVKYKMGHWLLAGCLVVFAGLLLPPTAQADSPDSSKAEKCAECHQEETEAWQDSPHARASANDEMPGAICQDCHAGYVKDHEESASYMELDVDSSICQDCHSNTYAQWQTSTHAAAGVQCIGCHMSHSQEFRLTDEALCSSCHRDQIETFSHTAHGATDISCVDCHVAQTPSNALVSLISDGSPPKNLTAPTHDFATVSAHNCMVCHDVMTVHEKPEQISVTYDAKLQEQTDLISTLSTRVKAAEETSQSLQKMSVIFMGLGMWIGAVLGVIMVLIIGYIRQERAK